MGTGYVDKATTALILREQVCRFHIYNGKILDITEADTNHHTASLSMLGTKVVAIITGNTRVSGTGYLAMYPPGAGADSVRTTGTGKEFPIVVGIENNELEYALSVANDDYDVHCFGYWTQGVSVD